MNKTLALLPLFFVACNSSTESGPVPTDAAAPIAHVAEAAPAAAPFVLTDELVAKYIVYTREMLPVMGAAMGVATTAFAKGGTDADKFADAAKGDSRVHDIAKAGEAALAKAGLTQVELNQITTLVTEYSARAMVAADMRKSLEEAEAKAQPAKGKGKGKNKAKQAPGGMGSVMVDVYKKQLAEFDAFKAEFATKHGGQAAAALDKHVAELVELQKAVLDAALKPRR